jgi:predicted amidohydrolase
MDAGASDAQELLPAGAEGWSAFAARPTSAPAVSVSRAADGFALHVAGSGASNVYGGWRARVDGIAGGAHYRFRARALPADVASLRESLTIVLRWSGSFGDEVAPDTVWDWRPAAEPRGALDLDRVIRAPDGSRSLVIELVLQWSARGRVAFDRLSLAPAAPPETRRVRVAAIHYRPAASPSGRESVRNAAEYAEQVAIAQRPDVMVLGEELNVIGAPGTLDDKAESVPGPSTEVLAGVARRRRVNVAFGLLEREGDRLYNAAVLLDRSGAIAGKYRKVQLPLQDASAGVTPGDSVPVFDLDFGRVALLICQDAAFPEPAREATLQGAELLLVPIWGGKTSLVRARAIENGVYLAASGYDYASEVVDPMGAVLASIGTIPSSPKAAVADIDLARRFREPWLGDWRDIANKERRAAPYRYRLP